MLLVAGAMAPAWGQGIESALSPGKLVQGHARWDDQCAQCHVRFDRAAQDGLCMGCHKDVAADIAGRTGWHGRQKPQACRACHTDHKGREARIAAFDTRAFDHAQTDYPLLGAHKAAACTACHAAPAKYRDAPKDCIGCHRADDTHQGSLGSRCGDCHSPNRWREARFDHDRTRFALTGRHADTACSACHKKGVYRGTPATCVACHRQDDDKRGHQGRFGEKCESCHTTRDWKEKRFNHDTDTRFVLRGSHRAASCTGCHTGPLYRVKPPQACFDCHRKDDKHKESLGRECGNCHTERQWKERDRFDHAKTRFPLAGRHAQATCQSCHADGRFRETPRECVGCHQKDDRHAGTLGTACANCHVERDWKDTRGRFNHDRTGFVLRNAHASPATACTACHRDAKSFRGTPKECVGCHRKDDRHEGQLGTGCATCHDDSKWKSTRFDHARTRFALTGRHAVAACKDCHASARFKDARSECVACHRKDDKHAARLGSDCASCHNARAWALWSFDHDRRSAFKLEGAHKPVACEACHRQPAPPGRPVAPLGNTCAACHLRDDVHDGQFGPRCEQCHSATTWKQLRTERAPSAGPGRQP